MIKEAMDRIIGLAQDAQDEPIVIDGRTYWGKSGDPIKPPMVSPVADVYSLDALLSALDAPEVKGLAEDLLCSLQIVVSSPTRVSVATAPDCTWCQRDKYIEATDRGGKFPFDHYIEIEDFIIKAQCLFVDTDTKAALISHVSSICGEEAVTNSDDGISQEVVVTSKINSRKEHAKFTPVLELRPYRTFPEVEQPSSRFLLRISKSKDAAPLVALFEADGGLWKAQACANVAAYLRNDKRVKERGIAVIG